MNYENIFYDVQVYAYRMGYLMESNKNVLKRLETLCVVLVKSQTRLRWRCEGVSTRPKKKEKLIIFFKDPLPFYSTLKLRTISSSF